MGSRAQKDTMSGVLATNRKARHDFHVLNVLEAGIALVGTEVKSIRAGHANLTGAYARTENGELWLHSMNIPAYEHGNRFNHEPDRRRRLLMHAGEIRKLTAAVEQQGQALVPLKLYTKQGLIKVELAVCRGKTHGDRRETLRERDTKREMQREAKR